MRFVASTLLLFFPTLPEIAHGKAYRCNIGLVACAAPKAQQEGSACNQYPTDPRIFGHMESQGGVRSDSEHRQWPFIHLHRQHCANIAASKDHVQNAIHTCRED